MIRILISLLVFFASTALAEIKISDEFVRIGYKEDYPTTIYLKLHNIGNQLDYLLGAQVINNQNANVTINKTVIEKGVVRIIRINQLTLPANSIVELAPQGIYLVVRNINKFKLSAIRLYFKYAGAITYIINKNEK